MQINKRELVVARFNESTDWMLIVSEGIKITVVQKGTHMPNKGREPTSFLYHIINRYDNLSDVTVFCQGNPFDHSPDFYKEILGECSGYKGIGRDTLICDGNGLPQHNGLKVNEGYKFINGNPLTKKISFVRGGQFMVTKEMILKRSKSFYEELLSWVLSMEDNHPWVMERLWGELFSDKEENKMKDNKKKEVKKKVFKKEDKNKNSEGQ